MVLMRDKNVDPAVFDDVFTPQKFVEIIFSLIISSLLRHDYDCAALSGWWNGSFTVKEFPFMREFLYPSKESSHIK